MLSVERRSINPGLETVRGTEFNLPYAGLMQAPGLIFLAGF